MSCAPPQAVDNLKHLFYCTRSVLAGMPVGGGPGGGWVTRYDVYLEVGESGVSMAHVLQLPGCAASGASLDVALANVVDAIADYYDWLGRPPSLREEENTLLGKLIEKIHDESRTTAPTPTAVRRRCRGRCRRTGFSNAAGAPLHRPACYGVKLGGAPAVSGCLRPGAAAARHRRRPPTASCPVCPGQQGCGRRPHHRMGLW